MKNNSTLKRLASLSKTLNEASDLISTQVTGLESTLNGLRLGVSAWVEVERFKELVENQDSAGEDEKKTMYELTFVRQLGYAKYKGKWALLVAEGYEEFFDGDDIGTVALLRDAKREVKLAAVDKIPALLLAIEEKALKVTADIARKAEQVHEIADALDIRGEGSGRP